MIRYLRAIAQERRRIKDEKLENKLRKEIVDDIISERVLRRIAEEYGYHFEIQRPDGLIFRFQKEGKELPEGKGGTIF